MNGQVQEKKIFARNRHGQLIALGAAATGATSSHAAVDVSAAEDAINDAVPAVTTLGTAVLGVLVVAAVFKWVRRVF